MKVFCLCLALLTFTAAASMGQESQYYQPIRNNDVAAVKSLIKTAGTDVRDSSGDTPLMLAAAVGSTDAMRLLLDAGADANAVNKEGDTALMWCANDLNKVRLLLNHGAKVDARNALDRTPLELAAYSDGSIEVVKLLIAHGAAVNQKDKLGITPLAMAAETNNVAVGRLLLERGAAVDTVDAVGQTPLHDAAFSGYHNADFVRMLLQHGAKVNAQTPDAPEAVQNGPIRLGRITPLHLAVTSTVEATKALVDAGADVNAQDVRQATPLVYAVATDHPNLHIVKLLLAHGASREPAILWAKRYNNPAVLHALGLATPARPTVETAAASEPRQEVAAVLARALSACKAPATDFLKKGGCAACHAQYFTGLALGLTRGASVEAQLAAEQQLSGLTQGYWESQAQGLLTLMDPPGGVDEVAHAMLHLDAAGAPAGWASDAAMHYLAAAQRSEGDWELVGLVRPPLEDGAFSDTAACLRLLRRYGAPGLKTEMDERIARGVKWLLQSTPTTTEDRTMQILGLVWAGATPPESRVRELINGQRADGGWGQTDTLPCDAYATGEALWALHEAGIPTSDPAYQRGVRYLLRSQDPDGTWHVATRSFTFQPYFESGFPYGPDQWISQTGTALATIALSYAGR